MGSKRIPGLWDRDLLERWYCDEGATQVEIARRLGCTQRAVWAALHRHGLHGQPRTIPATGPDELRDVDWLRDQYVDQRRSMKTIARLLGVGVPKVQRALVAAGLHEPRPAPEPEPVVTFPDHWRFLGE